MKKEKAILLLIVLIGLFILLFKIIKTDTKTYKLKIDKNKFIITEKYSDNTYINIKINNTNYPIRLFNDFKGKKKLVDNIYYYKDKSYECILPIIENNVYTDVMCYKEKTIYNYINIKGKDKKLDKFVDDIEEYDIDKYNNKAKFKSIKTTKYNKNYKNNFAITTYKGLISNGVEINLFKKDIYKNELSTFINNYYVVADYNKKYEFNNFYVVNLDTNEVKTIKSKTEISFDSYIEGIVDNKIYLYDIDNENQYEINIEKEEINIVSSDDDIKYYSNKKWSKLSKNKAKNETLFDYESLDNVFTEYDTVIENDNYYYLIKGEKLYRVDKNNIDVKTYILNIPTKDLKTYKDIIYYVYKDTLYYYSDVTGLIIVLENSELEFNNTIKYYIY